MFFNSIDKTTDNDYFSIKIDYVGEDKEMATISLYVNGNLAEVTSCSKSYLDTGDLFNDEPQFTVGIMGQMPGDASINYGYSKFDLYACRLYTRLLTDTEIQQNYTATTDYHNELVK